MPKLRNTKREYGSVAILLHWIMAVFIITLIALGLYMVDLPKGLAKLKFIGWHKELGILVLGLAILRASWRLSNVTPLLLSYLPTWEAVSARLVHWTFYLLMIILPLTGWMMSSAAGLPVSFFGLFVLPDLVSPNAQGRILFQQIHIWLAYAMIGLIILHVAAAFKHHFINKDNIMRRMLP
jgi:cytochrome b561